MIDYAQIRDDIISELTTFLGHKVIVMDDNHPKPKYPFMTFNIINPYTPESPHGNETYMAVASTDPDWEYDIIEIRSEQPTITISMTAYSCELDEAEELALQALSWFKFYGLDYLDDKEIVIIETTQVQERDTLLINDYERRKGFDVKIRVLSELENRISTIETVDLKRK